MHRIFCPGHMSLISSLSPPLTCDETALYLYKICYKTVWSQPMPELVQLWLTELTEVSRESGQNQRSHPHPPHLHQINHFLSHFFEVFSWVYPPQRYQYHGCRLSSGQDWYPGDFLPPPQLRLQLWSQQTPECRIAEEQKILTWPHYLNKTWIDVVCLKKNIIRIPRLSASLLVFSVFKIFFPEVGKLFGLFEIFSSFLSVSASLRVGDVSSSLSNWPNSSSFSSEMSIVSSSIVLWWIVPVSRSSKDNYFNDRCYAISTQRYNIKTFRTFNFISDGIFFFFRQILKELMIIS